MKPRRLDGGTARTAPSLPKSRGRLGRKAQLQAHKYAADGQSIFGNRRRLRVPGETDARVMRAGRRLNAGCTAERAVALVYNPAAPLAQLACPGP